ncbi:hypothetical protein [Streptomyces sp. NBC_01408]|uniref:hypothetical protein n=1 Tax=Streptomyces sp. NBC_01408 TaxID=2903855 RepID=UPI002256C500|nr:hypothetical protein [Streptomyces sp. NBC_01408]MCX4695502.1 hypothetical protein [Streptomyces sp. NBC_01408]
MTKRQKKQDQTRTANTADPIAQDPAKKQQGGPTDLPAANEPEAPTVQSFSPRARELEVEDPDYAGR